MKALITSGCRTRSSFGASWNVSGSNYWLIVIMVNIMVINNLSPSSNYWSIVIENGHRMVGKYGNYWLIVVNMVDNG